MQSGFIFNFFISKNNYKTIEFEDLKDEREIFYVINNFCLENILNDFQKEAIFEIIKSYQKNKHFDINESFYTTEKFENDKKNNRNFDFEIKKKELKSFFKENFLKNISKTKEKKTLRKQIKSEKIRDNYVKNYFGNYNYFPVSLPFNKYIEKNKNNISYIKKFKNVYFFLNNNKKKLKFEDIDICKIKNEYVIILKKLFILIIRDNKEINFQEFCILIKKNNLSRDIIAVYDLLEEKKIKN